jgi:ribonuclease HI
MSEEVKENITAFIYCDGSAGPTNPGPTGYGIHIVIASNTVKSKNVIGKYKLTPNGYMTLPEYKNRDDKTLLGLRNGIEIYGYTENSLTNNTAELDAVIEALKFLPKLESSIECKIDVLEFKLDSTYVLNSADKILHKDLSIDDVVANKDRVGLLKEEILKVKDKYEIYFSKVKAHTDDLGNNRADLLANMGRELRKKKERSNQNFFIGDVDFWKEPVVDADLYHYKQLFSFYPDVLSADRSYFGLNYKEESEFGKKISNISYTVMKVAEVNEVIFDTIKTIRDVLGDHYVPYLVRLKDLLNKNLLRDYLRYKEDFLIIEYKQHLSIKSLTGIEVARELYPPALSAIVMDKFLILESELLSYLNNDGVLPNTVHVDITDLIYEKDAKGNTIIRKDLKNDKPIITYIHDNTKINMLMKYDMPPRNTLKRLEKKEPKVMLAITDLGGVIEYKTIITLNNNDAMMTSNTYSNKTVKRKKKK